MASRSGPRLVVGVDFGTTYSGFAWAEIRSEVTNSAKDLNPEPKVVFFQATEEPKIPSQICYCTKDLGDTTVRYRWGSDAEKCCLRTPYKFFKLQLGHRAEHHEYGTCVDDQGDFANRLADPFELFVELLAGMRTEFMSILVQKYSQVHKYNEEDFRIDWFFTIPPFINNDPGLPGRLVTEFLPRAGFTEPTTLSINHIFEPEAAAIRVLSQSLLAPRLSPLSQGFPKLQKGDKILVCDGGGGTTDLFALQIVEFKIDEQKSVPDIKMQPLSPTDMADRIGAIDINKAFRNYLDGVLNAARQHLNEARQNLPPEERDADSKNKEKGIEADRRVAIRTFESYKIQYEEEAQMNWIIRLPSLRGVTIPNKELKEGVLQLSHSHMQQFFAEVLRRVTNLLNKLLHVLGNANHQISTMILVGGLGASPYMQNQLASWARGKDINLVCLSPRDALSAVVCGAAQHGVQQILLGRPTSTHIIPTKSYGFIIDRYTDHDSTEHHSPRSIVRDRIEWVAKKGIPLRLQDSGPALGTVTVQATTPIYLDLKPGKNDLVLPQHSGYSKYKLVICRDIDPDQLPRTYDAAETRVQQHNDTATNCGPYRNLKDCFAKKRLSSNNLFSRGQKYWEGTIELCLELSTGERVITTSRVLGGQLAQQDQPAVSQYERQQSSRKFIRWFS